MQLGKTGFIQLRLSPELCGQLWVVLLGPPVLKPLLPEVKGFGGSRPNLSDRRRSVHTHVCWKRDLLDNKWLSCVPAVTSRGLTSGRRLQQHWHSARRGERSLGFSCSKLFKNSHWIVISFVYNA